MTTSTRHHLKRIATIGLAIVTITIQSGVANAATYTFTQTSWSGGVTANNADHDPINNQAEQGWSQYATATAYLSTGTDLQVTTAASSTTQTDDGATVTGFNLADSSLSQTTINGSGSDASVQLSPATSGFGSGADGAITISTSKNINTDTIATGRTCADGISYNVIALTANTATLNATPPAGCFAAGDKVMLLNAQGDGSITTNVGNYEFLEIQSISGNTITFTTSKTKYYGGGATSDPVYNNWQTVSSGVNHTLAIKTDGTLWAWGSGSYGKLGLGDAYQRNWPVQVGTGTNWQKVSAGTKHSLGVKTDGTLWAWGYNAYGQLGLGNTTQQTSPVQVGTDTNWQEVETGDDHSLALKTDGTVWAWGFNSTGQLGLGDTTQRTSPVQIGTATNWQKISAGLAHSFAIKSDGTLWGWGKNSSYQLGLGNTTQQNSPVQVGTDINWQQVSAGGDAYGYTMAIKTDGTLWAWGAGNNGRLGLGDISARTSPTQLGTGAWQQVSAGAGNAHTLAIKTDGTLWAWGYNSNGQLGLGDATQRTSPVQVGTATNWQIVAGGQYYSAYIQTSGVMSVAGQGGNGALGLGGTNNQNSLTNLLPQRVVVQRVPQYTNVTIASGGTLTSSGWDGQKGGVLIFYASGSVDVQSGGNINVNNKGYRGYFGGDAGQGESYHRFGGYGDSAANLGGGGGYFECGEESCLGSAGAGGYATNGASVNGGGGGTYGEANLTKIYLGSGGGTSGSYNGGNGGGIMYIAANSLAVSGGLTSNGGNGNGGGVTENYNAGGGSGGSVYISGNSLSIGSGLITASGGTATWGNASVGRIHLKSNSITGTTSPTAGTSVLLTEYYTAGTFTSGVMDLGQISGYTTLTYTASTTAQATVTIDVRSGNTATPDGTWTAWQTGVASGGDISGMGANRYFQYRANLATSDNLQTPTVHDVTVNYTAYATNQMLASSKYDTSSADNAMGSIAWDEDASLPTGTTVTVSLRTASSSTALDEATWYDFTASSTNCTKTDVTVSCPSAALASASASLADGVNDQWYQYKVLVTSTGANTPTIPEVRVQYVVNAPPDFTAVSAAQIATSSDPNLGKIEISYSVRDIDGDTGSITPGYVTPSFEYNIGGGWVAIDSAYLSAGAVEDKIVTQVGYAAYSTIWDAKTQTPEQYVTSAQVRVTANDNEPANNTGQATAAAFVLDTKSPVILGTVNGTSEELSFAAADDQNVSYKLSNNSDGSYDSVNATSGQWVAVGAPAVAATTTWDLAGEPSNQRVYLFASDDYGNIASTTVVGPVAPTYFDLKDASNVLIDNYKIFLSWKAYTATTSAAFNRYELYRSTDGFTYGLASTITNASTNYYTDNSLASSTTYYYKLLTVDGDDDVSPYSTTLSHQPSGQGGTDSTKPTISAVTVAEYQSTYAKITFSTNELAFGTVEYGAEGGAPYALSVAKDTIATDHSIVLTDLTPNTNYTFRVKARDIASNEETNDNSGAGYAFTTRGGPIITDVTATLADDRNATIVWNTNEDSDSGLVYAETAAALTSGVGTTAVQDATLVGGEGPLYQHKVALTGLTPRTTYYYYVQSTDADSNAAVDKNGLNYYTFTTSYDRKAPNVSNISTPVVTETAVVVLWKTDELADTQVSYGTTSGSYTETTTLDTNMSIVHAVTLTGLTAATTYYYVVKSTDPGGNATTSAEQTVTTAAAQEVKIVTIGGGSGKTNNPPPDVKDTQPAVISNIAVASTTAFSAVLTFDTNEPTVIGLRYGRTPAYDRAEASIDWKRSHEVRLSGLRLGSEYHYQIKAIDKGGNEAFSDDMTFTTKFVADASETARTIENLQQYEQEIEESIESILPSILPPFVEEATVAEVTESTATINWRTNINTYAAVAYATEEEYTGATTTRNPYTGEISDLSAKTREHSLMLIGLRPNTTYHFRTKAFSVPQVIGEGRDMTFTTKAPAVQASVIDVKTTSFRAAWTTEVPASSIVEYKNLANGIIERIINEELTTYHDILVENLRPGNRYEVKVFGYSAVGNLLSSGVPINVLTSTDIAAPKISNFKVDGALVPGRTDRIQTIVSWTTDEPSTGIVEYQEGAGSVADGFANKVEVKDSYVTNHVVILTNLKPGTIYQFKITSTDQAGNTASFGPRTIITPQKGESIFDVIFKNFEDTFKFLRGAGQ